MMTALLPLPQEGPVSAAALRVGLAVTPQLLSDCLSRALTAEAVDVIVIDADGPCPPDLDILVVNEGDGRPAGATTVIYLDSGGAPRLEATPGDGLHVGNLDDLLLLLRAVGDSSWDG